MKKKTSLIIFMLSNILLFSFCTREKPIELSCTPLPLGPAFGWKYYYPEEKSLVSPCFNPENSNEIAYVEVDLSNGVTKRIFKYNFMTMEKQLIFEGDIVPPVKYGIHNCFLFEINKGNICLYNKDKNLLTNLVSDRWCSNPSWSFDYISIYYEQQYFYDQPDDTPAQSTLGIQIDLESNIIDTVFEWSPGCYSLFEDKVAFTSATYLYIVDLNTREWTEIFTWDIETGLGLAITWIDERTIIWSKDDGIFKSDIYTRKSECIRASCNSALYLGCNYSTEKNKIIWQKYERIPEGEEWLICRSYFVMMDTDGTNEEEILIP